MMDTKARTSGAVIILLLLLLLVLWISLRNTKAFFLVGSCDACVIFLTLLWAILQHALAERPIIDAAKLQILAFIFSFLLLGLVVLLCVRVSYSTTFYLVGSTDILATLTFISLWCIKGHRAKARRQRRELETSSVALGEEVRLESGYIRLVGGLPKSFRYEELEVATSHFQYPIGRGGSASVFKGTLSDGSSIAVKRIEGQVHGERQFLSEISTIASVHHANLVRLLGYCLSPAAGRILVYELIENGSLDAWIFPRTPGRTEVHLSWSSRYQIAIDVAKALAYLHHDCRSRILHLDIKPENILLDEEFRARVSDFGISRMMEKDETSVITTVRGTRGYLAPEWFLGDGISNKSDVYSYGMVLMELVSGQRNLRKIENGSNTNTQETWLYFPRIVSERMREEKLMEIVDERLARDGEIEEREVKKLVYVALWCAQDKKELRPSMSLVVDMLKGHVEVGMPPETGMFMLDVLSSDTERLTSSTRARVTTPRDHSLEIDYPLMPTYSSPMPPPRPGQ